MHRLSPVAGCGEGSFGPHKARELLQLKDDCFSPKIDPLQALYVFGAPGRQVRWKSLAPSSNMSTIERTFDFFVLCVWLASSFHLHKQTVVDSRDLDLPRPLPPPPPLTFTQIAERLNSFRRASLDLSGPFCSTIEARPGLFHDDAYEQNSEAVDSRPNPSETKALSAAARDFLSRRCSASLATAALSARHQERISQALVSGVKPLLFA